MKLKEQIDTMKIAAAQKVKDPQETVKNVTKHWGLTEKVGKGVLESFIEQGDFTRWNLLNAVTFQVHKTKDNDRQYDLEKIGGELMEANNGLWNQIVA